MDIGEGFPYDADLLDYATSANVCCGDHAGSWELTLETIELCKRKGARIGMHPGFPNRESMGRVPPRWTGEDWDVWQQNLFDQLRGFQPHQPHYVKPHGAWYNVLCSPPRTYDGVLATNSLASFHALLEAGDLKAMLLAGSEIVLGRHALTSDWMGEDPQIIREGFADRRYLPNGSLAPRSEQEAVLHDKDKIAEQVRRLAFEVDSICVHGDTPGCVEIAELVRTTLTDAGYEVAA